MSVRAAAFGHGIMASLLGKSEDEALSSWCGACGDTHVGLIMANDGWEDVRRGWGVREWATWRPADESVTRLAARAPRREGTMFAYADRVPEPCVGCDFAAPCHSVACPRV